MERYTLKTDLLLREMDKFLSLTIKQTFNKQLLLRYNLPIPILYLKHKAWTYLNKVCKHLRTHLRLFHRLLSLLKRSHSPPNKCNHNSNNLLNNKLVSLWISNNPLLARWWLKEILCVNLNKLWLKIPLRLYNNLCLWLDKEWTLLSLLPSAKLNLNSLSKWCLNRI